MFRCPSCGQAHEMKINDDTVLSQNKEMTVLFLNGIETDKDATVRGNPDIECQECKAENPLEDWQKAFQDPGMYFDMEDLCHCGGELWMDQIPGTPNYGFVCDKCQWVKPKKVVSGG